METKAVADLIGYIAAAIGICVFMPQVIRCIRTKRTKDISFLSFFLLALVSFLWIIYGFLKFAPPIILVNVLILILSIIMLSLKRKYG